MNSGDDIPRLTQGTIHTPYISYETDSFEDSEYLQPPPCGYNIALLEIEMTSIANNTSNRQIHIMSWRTFNNVDP
jgi:hypothetical protein